MPEQLHAYRNVTSGDLYVFAAERPDLAARPNFEDADLDEVPEGIKQAALREAAAAASLEGFGQHDPEAASPAPAAGGAPDPASGVFQIAVSGKPAIDGVLSRNIVKAPQTSAELGERDRADAETLAMHGVLAEHLEDDGEPVRIEVAGGADADIVNPKPVGDVGKSSDTAKKATATARRRGQPGKAAQQETQRQQQTRQQTAGGDTK
jgi:hypothetical protein